MKRSLEGFVEEAPIKKTSRKEIGLFILTYAGLINAATKSDYCKSQLLNEGLLNSNDRSSKSGYCRQNYITLMDKSIAKRFCRKRFPVAVTTSTAKSGQIKCEWGSLSSCPSDSTYILGNCYKFSASTNFENAGKLCGKFGMDLAYVTGADVAYWIATFFQDQISHMWIRNSLTEDNPLILRAMDPVTGEEVVVSDGSSYKSGPEVAKTEKLVISTRHDSIYEIWQLGAFIKADPAAKFPSLCARAAISNDPKVAHPLLPYGSMSHNLYTFNSDQISVRDLTSVESASIHKHCQALTGQVCTVPRRNRQDGYDMKYWVSAELRRSNRSDYDDCDPAYDIEQEYLLYDYVSPRKTIGILLTVFAANEPKPMCADIARAAVQADTSGFMAVPPIARRPLLPGPDALADVERLSCDCVSKPPSTICDRNTRICKCAKPYEPVKDQRYIEGYKCVAPPTTTIDPCSLCKQHSKCVSGSAGIHCECENGYEDAERPGEAKNGVCKKKCKCGSGATCTDDEGNCACTGSMVDVSKDPNRQLSQEERERYRQSLHCAKECSCTEYAYCKGITPVCECSSSATDAMDLNPSEYEDLSPPVTGRGQLCLLHTCKEVKENMQLAIVMDHSGSINPFSYQQQQKFLIALVRELNPELTTLYVIAFSHEMMEWTFPRGRWTVPEMVTFMTTLQQLFKSATSTPAAVLRAFQLVMSEPVPHKAIFLLTDGEPNCLPRFVRDYLHMFWGSYGRYVRCEHWPYVCVRSTDFVRVCLGCLEELGDMIRQADIKLFGVVVDMGNKLNLLRYNELHQYFVRFVGGNQNLQEINDFSQLASSAKNILRHAFRQICRYQRVDP